ncbi:MAG: MFS transporter [Acidipropionibacterium sp.]|nr:MFS transporter [Acidipropionibacterium sp.]
MQKDRATPHGEITSAATATGIDAPSVQRLQRRTLGALSAAQILGALGGGAIPSVGVLLAEQVTSSEVWAGLARTGSTIGAALAGLPLAALALRRGRRWALGIGWLVSAAGTALLVLAAQVQNLVALVIGLLIAGVGSASQLQARFAATDLAAPSHKGRALSTVVWVGAIGSILGPNLGAPGEWLARRVGMADMGGAFVLGSVFLLLAGIVTLTRLRPDPLLTAQRLSGALVEPGSPRAAGRRRAGPAEIRRLCRVNRPALLALVAIITAQMVMVTVMTMAPVQISRHGGSLTVVGVSISLHILGMYGLAPVSGMVGDRFGARTGMAIGVVLFVASFAVTVIDVGSTTAVTVSLVLLGLGWSFMNVAGSASLSSSVPDDLRTGVQGFADTSSNVAAAVGAFIGGPIMMLIGYDGLAVVAAVVLIPVCVMLIGFRGSRASS